VKADIFFESMACRIAMAKAAFNKKRALILAHWTWNWGRS